MRSHTSTAERERWIALVVLCAGFLMIILDGSIVNVALPSIQSDLGFSQSSLAWVVNAYLIAFGGLLLLAGRRVPAGISRDRPGARAPAASQTATRSRSRSSGSRTQLLRDWSSRSPLPSVA